VDAAPLRIQTISCHSRGRMRNIIDGTDARVFLCQEHRLIFPEDIDQASAWGLRRGWKSAWPPAAAME
ncbi:unnamed protein product, partial [Prorocentrum cordatum]